MNQSLACLFFAATVATLGVTPPVTAAPIFPPAHRSTQAAFAAAGTPARLEAGPWYRPARSVVATPREVLLEVADRITVTPWYRAAN